MAETQSAEINLEELLNKIRTQPLQEQLDNIRFRPLAAKAEKRKAKIDKQKKKAAKLTDKINKGNQKINKWKAKIADAQKTKAYCKQLLATHSLPKPLQMFFQGLMDKQDKKIERCQGKISQKEQKIKKLKGKRSKWEKKIQKQQAKIDKIAGIDRFITNMGTAQGRRENFVQVLTGMRKSSLEQKKEKLAAVQKKIARKESALSKATSETEKVKLQQQIDKLKDQKDKLEGKINRLEAMAEKLDAFAAMTEQDADKVMDAATEGAKATFEYDMYDDYDLDDVFVVEADKAFGNQQIEHELSDEDKVVIAQLENEVLVDRLYYGEVSKETMQHIQQAGFEFDGYKFTKAEPTQEDMQEGFEMYFETDEPDESEQQTEQKTEQQDKSESEQQSKPEPEQQAKPEPEPEQQGKPEPEQQGKPEPEQQVKPEPEQQAKQNQPQQGEHGTAQKAAQGNGQTAGAGKQSDLVKFSGLSGTHIQALKDSNITFWVKKESENTFSAFVHRSDAEQAKGILSSVSQAQKKAASSFRQPHRKM